MNNHLVNSGHGTMIGYVIGGGLKENLHVRLTVPASEIQEGAFVVIISGEWVFFGLVTDIQLGATDPRFADEQSESRFPDHLTGLLYGKTLYTNLEVLSALMLNRGPEPGTSAYQKWQAELDAGLRDHPHPIPVKSVPPHHAPVFLASGGDIAEIFGKPEKENNFVIGYTREQGHPVCLDLEKFILRSSGIFGATGTGKSFLTRIILAGLIQYNKASVLVYDMHNEYGFDDMASDSGQRIMGLRSLFPARVRVVGLGRGANIRGNPPDFNLEIAESDIMPEDIEMLTRELNLKETTPATLEALVSTFGSALWFSKFKSMKNTGKVPAEDDEDKEEISIDESVAIWANSRGINQVAAESLHSKLGRVFRKDYIVQKPASDGIRNIVEALQAGQHIVLSFGDYETDLDYLLVSNLLTRRIREVWEEQTNSFRSDKKSEIRPLVIVLEEAHKLLNREIASQTTFSTIAREMRKYYVTLLVVDQRPSQIYDEVMSQLGTRISGWLGDDDDIRAVLSGLAGREVLRGMLARLQPKEEVLMLGWGIQMPIPVNSRRYDTVFWDEIKGRPSSIKHNSRESDLISQLGYDPD